MASTVSNKPSTPIGVDEESLAPVLIDWDSEGHLIAFGDSECGKSSLLRMVGRSITDHYSPEQARLIVADFRRSLLGQFSPEHLLGYAHSGKALVDILASVRTALNDRMPGPEVTPRQLRERSWWHGPDVFLLVDDYDLVASAGNALMTLVDYLPQARDMGLRLVITRRMGGASRAMFDPVIQRLRELDCSVLMMSGSPEEGTLLNGLKPCPLPPGRGTLIRRKDGARLTQLAWVEERVNSL